MDNRSRRNQIRKKRKTRVIIYTILLLITCTTVLGAVKIFDLTSLISPKEITLDEESQSESEVAGEDENKEDLLIKQEHLDKKESLDEEEPLKQEEKDVKETAPEKKVEETPEQTNPKAPSQENINSSSSAKSGDTWNLILVNPWNELPEGFSVERTTLINGHSVDERAYPDLQQMMDDCRAGGLAPLICSSYRTVERQTTLFNNQIAKYKNMGYSEEAARTEAAKWVAVPGTSEHHTGLALDIVATSNQILNEEQANTAEQQWLMKNSYKYGFILRYPKDKQDITGITYEPWHYRYVGKEVAKEIYEQGICLEEYLQGK